MITGFAASGSKATPLEADGVVIVDTAASNIIKRVTWANIKATLKTYFDTLYAVYATTTTNGPVELATTAEGETGTDTARVPAVDVVKAMVTTHTPPTIAGMSYGDIGSYIFGIVETTGFTGGAIFAGADIRPAALGAVLTTLADDTRSAGTASALWSGSGALSGTWQAMGGSEADGASQRTRATLFLRVT
ncbi:MAG: hypothetical protein L3J33_03425 [Rhodobacteraceae bacterium]|nr:hypothetical protein [Paracoccaceae bacterium]